MHGTWQTTGGGSGLGLVLLIIGALILLGSGAAAAIATAVVVALIALAVVVVLAIVALIAYLIWRARRDIAAAPARQGIIPAPAVHQLAAPERPAIPQQLHLHFDSADPAAVAEILRRHQAE